MTIGEKLSVLRKRKGYTQDDVAERLGVTPQAISKWENDASCPDIMLLTAIADMFDVTVDDLLRGETAPAAVMVPAERRKSIDDMVLRILVKDDEDTVKVNLPMALARIVLENGGDGVKLNFGKADLSGVDWKQIMNLVERGAVGRLVEVESSDGDTVIIEIV